MKQQGILQGSIAMPRSGMGYQAGGLVDDEYIVIFMDDFQWQVLRLAGVIHFQKRMEGNLFAAKYLVSVRYRPTVQQGIAVLDPALQLAT